MSAQIVRSEVVETAFNFYSDTEKKESLAVCKIENEDTIDTLGKALNGGLYDPRMGPLDFTGTGCQTCGLRYANCPGHPGYVELDLPVYYPILFSHLFQILRSKCSYCHKLRVSEFRCRCMLVKLQLLEMGDVTAAQNLEDAVQPPSGVLPDEDGVSEGARVGSKNASKGTNKGARGGLDAEEASADADRLLRSYEQRYHAFATARQRKQRHAQQQGAPVVVLSSVSSSFASSSSGSTPAVGAAERKLPGVPADRQLQALQTQAVEAFMRLAMGVKACENCGAHSPPLRKDGYIKLFRRPLPKKLRKKMLEQGRGHPKNGLDVLAQLERAKRVGSGARRSGSTFNLSAVRRSVLSGDGTGGWGSGGGDGACSDEDGSQTDGDSAGLRMDILGGGGGDETTDREDLDEEADETEGAADSGSEDVDSDVDGAGAGQGQGQEDEYLAPVEVEAQLQLLWRQERSGALLDFIWGRAASVPLGRSQRATLLDGAGTAGGDGADNGGPGGECWRMFLTRVLLVPPNRFRAAGKLDSSSGTSAEHPQNVYLKKVIQTNRMLRQLMAGQTEPLPPGPGPGSRTEHDHTATAAAAPGSSDAAMDLPKVVSNWIKLQNAVNCYMDSSKDADALKEGANGIRQVLEKKEGLFRRHMMGKRVNFCCRSVISPDPYIGTNEIGIPINFAKTLHYPTPVNSFNVKHMRKLVENGPSIYPGANQIETADGRIIKLDKLSANERAGHAKLLLANPGTKVHRHLINGDVLMVNRQPTLHKPGIMAHRARVLRYVREQTLRMHYANCNTYNADFDGDEMNCHFVQSELARAEANYICNTDNQYIGPTDGAPLRGLIQDHVASGVKLTCKDSFLTRAEFQQLLYVGVSGLPGTEVISPVDTMHMPPPAVVKPRPLWTGKQVVSALLKHLCRSPLPPLHLDARTKTPASAFGEEHAEHAVVFRHSELLSGVLDKAAMGASSLGIVHTVYELYGAELAGRLLSAFGRLFTFHLQGAGHSCGIQDLTLAAEADRERRRLLLKVHSEAEACVMKFFSVPADADADDEDGSSSSNARTSRRLRAQREMAKYLAKDGDRRASKAQIDAAMQSSINQAASSVLKACLPSGLERPFLKNHFAMMVTTGAKGSTVNQSQVSCFLGQQALEGQRVPLMVSGKSLPSFRCFDVSARAGGFVQDRFLTGVRPQEYYFHCMAGREGLVDTAVKTARSGYLQRCLVKHLEDLRVHYDLTVRDSGANVVQFLYGEDGLDPVAAALLGGSPAQMRFLARNNQALVYKHSLHENFFSQGLEMSSAQAHHQRVESARRLVDLSQGRHDISHMAKGSVVLARRKRHDALDWSRGNVDTHWHVAVVMKVRRGHGHGGEKDDTRSAPPCFDLQYASDGAVAKKVPALVLFTRKAGAGGLNVDKGSVSGGQAALHLVRPGVPDPAMSVLALDRCVGACSEKIQDALRSYTSSPAARAEGVITEEGSDRSVTAESLELLLWVKYMRSLACPGEAVGCVAAQGVGEPSTQMTLNTFHLAGHGGANVTLGIPRLREIIMTASRNLKTPTMFAPVLTRSSSLSTVAGKAAAAAKARALARKLSRLSLSQLLSHQGGVEVLEFLRCPADAASARWQRIYRVRLCFEKPRTIEAAFGVRFEAVVGAVKEIMAGKLDAFIKLEQRRAGESASGGVGGLRGRPSKKQQQQQRPGLSEITGARNAGPDVPGSRASRSSSLATLDDDDNDEGESGADEAGATGRMTGRRVRDVLSEDVDPEELAGSSGGGGGGTGKSNRGATRRAAADCSDEDESDDDEDARGEGADDMGNLKLSGTGKETLGYADDDDDDDEDDDDGTGTRSAIDTDTDMGETDHYDEDTDLDVASIASGAKVPAGKRTGQIGKAASTSTAASSSRAAPAKAVSQASGSWVDPRHVTSFHRESFAHSEDPDEEGWVELELAFHSKARRLLMAQLVEKAAALTMVRATKDITAAYAVEEDGVQGVQTAGVNFEALWALPEGTVRLNAITSNDIHAILRTYGVEAARQSIVSEIKAVFGVYGISVDARHLSLIADFMTRGGSFTPLNRAGMLQSASPFQQMSFESTCTFLSRAAQEGLRDSLESPSARIVLGSVAKVGTGCFDLLQPLPHA